MISLLTQAVNLYVKSICWTKYDDIKWNLIMIDFLAGFNLICNGFHVNIWYYIINYRGCGIQNL